MKFINVDFEINLFGLNELPPFYSQVFDELTQEVLFENNGEKESLEYMDNGILVVKDIPEFFELSYQENKEVVLKKIKQYSGYLMDFTGFTSQEEYLKSRFGRSSRYKLRREKKRLQHCFDIRYFMYYGEIKKDEYDFLMDKLYSFLEIRSEEKGISHNVNLTSKEFYTETVYPMILQKKASLYVIFNGNTPIDICINFHIQDIVYQYIRTYDIAYSKFKTGYINLMNQIEWLIENNKKAIIFSAGNVEWKQKWCNSEYAYYYHYWFKGTSIKSKVLIAVELAKRRLRQFMVEKNIIGIYHQIFRRKHMLKKSDTLSTSPIMANSEMDFEKKKQVIDLNEEGYHEIRRHLNDFLYSAHEKEKEVTVYKYTTTPNVFLFHGKEKSMRLFSS